MRQFSIFQLLTDKIIQTGVTIYFRFFSNIKHNKRINWIPSEFWAMSQTIRNVKIKTQLNNFLFIKMIYIEKISSEHDTK